MRVGRMCAFQDTADNKGQSVSPSCVDVMLEPLVILHRIPFVVAVTLVQLLIFMRKFPFAPVSAMAVEIWSICVNGEEALRSKLVFFVK